MSMVRAMPSFCRLGLPLLFLICMFFNCDSVKVRGDVEEGKGKDHNETMKRKEEEFCASTDALHFKAQEDCLGTISNISIKYSRGNNNGPDVKAHVVKCAEGEDALARKNAFCTANEEGKRKIMECRMKAITGGIKLSGEDWMKTAKSFKAYGECMKTSSR